MIIFIELVRNMTSVSFVHARRLYDKRAGREERCDACGMWLVGLLLSLERVQGRKIVVGVDAKVLCIVVRA
jgi:hypothetical protein